MTKTIGMIETKGLAISLLVADTMLKTADVTIIRQETIDIILVSIAVQGDVMSVKEAIEKGIEIAIGANAYVSSNIISRPEIDTEELVKEIARKPN